MEAILKFNLPEDEEEFEHAKKGSTYHAALWDFYHNSIRQRLKHGDDNLKDGQLDLLEIIKNEFFDELNSRDINL